MTTRRARWSGIVAVSAVVLAFLPVVVVAVGLYAVSRAVRWPPRVLLVPLAVGLAWVVGAGGPGTVIANYVSVYEQLAAGWPDQFGSVVAAQWPGWLTATGPMALTVGSVLALVVRTRWLRRPGPGTDDDNRVGLRQQLSDRWRAHRLTRRLSGWWWTRQLTRRAAVAGEPTWRRLARVGAIGMWDRYPGVTYRPGWRQVPRQVPQTRVGRAAQAAAERLASHQHEVALGVSLTDRRPVTLTVEELVSHALVAGATGSGKTTTCLRLVGAAVERGWPAVLVDLEGDPGTVRRISGWCESASRRVRVWSIDGDAHYDPLAVGRAGERTDKLIALGQPRHPHSAERYLQLVCAACDATDTPATLTRIVELLRPAALAQHVRDHRGQLPTALARTVHDYVDELSGDQAAAVAALRTRLAILAESPVGARLGPSSDGTPAIDLRRSLVRGDIVVFSLNSSLYGRLAAHLATLVVQDLKTAAGARLADEGGHRRPVLAIIDEFSTVDGDQTLGLLARARAAHMAVVLATQELAELTRVSAEFPAQIVGNCATAIVHRVAWPDSARTLAGLAGTTDVAEDTRAGEHRRSRAPREKRSGSGPAPQAGTQPRVHPEELTKLPRGHAVVIRRGDGVRVDRTAVVALRGLDTGPSRLVRARRAVTHTAAGMAALLRYAAAGLAAVISPGDDGDAQPRPDHAEGSHQPRSDRDPDRTADVAPDQERRTPAGHRDDPAQDEGPGPQRPVPP